MCKRACVCVSVYTIVFAQPRSTEELKVVVNPKAARIFGHTFRYVSQNFFEVIVVVFALNDTPVVKSMHWFQYVKNILLTKQTLWSLSCSWGPQLATRELQLS